MPASTRCLRCGGKRLVTGGLEQGMSLCLDHESHHGVRPVAFQTTICQDCGHAEFWVSEPERLLGSATPAVDPVIQEEDF